MENKINVIKCKDGELIAFYMLTPNSMVSCMGKDYDELIKNFVDAYRTMEEYLKLK